MDDGGEPEVPGMSHPKFQAQNPRFSKDKFGWFACGPFSLAMGIEASKDIRHTGKDVRKATHDGDPTDGTNLDQLARAARAFGSQLTVRRRMAFDDLLDTIDDGHPVVVGLSYEPIHKTEHSGDVNFTGNHYVLLLPDEPGSSSGVRVFDPLCDGRPTANHLGSYTIDEALLAKATAHMVVDSGGNVVGHGRVYAGILPPRKNGANGPAPAPGSNAPGGPGPTVNEPPGINRPVTFRHGGEARARGLYLCTRDVANIRGNPHVTHFGAPAKNVVGHLRRGDSFHCHQTTDIGQKVAGSQRWFGDRAGENWVHSSVVKHT
jgi:hypothetical protein